MEMLVIYKYGYRICKVILIYLMLTAYGIDIKHILPIIIVPTFTWVYYFNQHSDILIHVGVLSIVTWIVYFVSYYMMLREDKKDVEIKKLELIKKIKRYEQKGLVKIDKEDLDLIYTLSLKELRRLYDAINVPEENKNKIEEGE